MNRRVLLAARPIGLPQLSDFSFSAEPIVHPTDGELLIAARYLSADPLQRWRMDETSGYGKTIALGEMVWGRMVGQVVQSRNRNWQEGDFAEGMLGWQEYAVSMGDTERVSYARGLTRVDPKRAPISTSLGILGMPGVTAYFALLDICNPQPGETVVVSAAAGTVGSLAGQIAKLRGCRVVGIAGGSAKVRYLKTELKFDAAIDYQDTANLKEALHAACPDRIHAYFDNVGGTVSDVVMGHLADHARIAVVGRVAQLGGPHDRADSQAYIISARALLQGFIVYDYAHRADEAYGEISGWLNAGKLHFNEVVHEGIESSPQALIDVLKGNGIGKHVIKIGDQ